MRSPIVNPTIGRRRYYTRLRPKHGWPELTALIDVLFLCALFFFLSGSFVWVGGIPVELPQGEISSVVSLEKYIVTLVPSAEGKPRTLYYFNDRPVNSEALKQQFNEVRGRSRNASIIIRADRRVPAAAMIEVMSLAEAADLNSFLAVQQPDVSSEVEFGQ